LRLIGTCLLALPIGMARAETFNCYENANNRSLALMDVSRIPQKLSQDQSAWFDPISQLLTSSLFTIDNQFTLTRSGDERPFTAGSALDQHALENCFTIPNCGIGLDSASSKTESEFQKTEGEFHTPAVAPVLLFLAGVCTLIWLVCRAVA